VPDGGDMSIDVLKGVGVEGDVDKAGAKVGICRPRHHMLGRQQSN